MTLFFNFPSPPSTKFFNLVDFWGRQDISHVLKTHDDFCGRRFFKTHLTQTMSMFWSKPAAHSSDNDIKQAYNMKLIKPHKYLHAKGIAEYQTDYEF